MMIAESIIDELNALGVTAILEEGYIVCEASGKTPVELQTRIRNNKASIIGQLSALNRLRSGQSWLSECANSFYEGVPTETPVSFSEMMVSWDRLELSIRAGFEFTGCINGPGRKCPPHSPIICDACTARGESNEQA